MKLMEIVRTVITVLYAGTGVAAVVGYLPTLRDLSRGVASANILSYLIWTITSAIGFLYASILVVDPLLMVVTGLNFVLCAAVLVMAARIRMRRKRV